MIFEARLKADQELVDAALKTYFTQSCSQARLLEAMRYSLLSGGKRLRPVLALAFCRACGGDEMAALPFACALEMVHTYSLIHDDLPCMDDDDFRRGRPTSHKVFGEAMAVLAGDALLTAAFETMLSKKNVSLAPARAAEAAACLAQAAGAYGMVGGQALDIGEEKELSAEELRKMYALKTGALIRAAAEIGCIVAGADHKLRDAALVYAEKVGVAFQIRDDLLDISGNAELMGKPTGSDAANGKTTFAVLFGPEECRHMIERETKSAIEALSVFPEPGYLEWLAEYMAGREK